jgi:hypothetical protein
VIKIESVDHQMVSERQLCGGGDPNSSSTPGIPNRNHSSTILTRK